MFLETSPGYQNSKACVRFIQQLGTAILLSTVACLSVGCAVMSPSTPSQSISTPKVSLSPSTVTMSAGAKQQFSATLTSTSKTAVTWHASAGTISSTGLFTAPLVTSSSTLTVSATSVENLSGIGVSQVTVVPLAKLAFSIHSLPAGMAGTPYSATLPVTGGITPYQWRITGGFLPQGLALDKASGVISGLTPQTGTFAFTTSVTDTSSTSVSAPFTLAISPSTTGNFDGPAELPRIYVQSALAATPAPGNVISVARGGDLQQALNSATCGDTITLQAGAVFTGAFRFPAQTCDDAHWITVRTSAPDSSLPPEGTRISPCYAGVTSLPGRPSLNCTVTNNVLAKVQSSATGSGPITLENGASHYRFLGLEITRTPSTGVVYNLVVNNGAADHVIFDRSWLHGTAQDETVRGIMLSGTRYAAVVDSYFSDFHCVAITGTCLDSQAIAGGLGDLAAGPFKIVDNFLESAGENILMGGGKATTTPTDIEIRQNHMFKPMTWMRGQPGYVGGVDGHPFIVKNLLELKNAQRVLIEGNIMEDAWGGFSQAGAAVLLTPKNQAGANGTNLCPVCQLTDVTLRYGTISHVGSGLVVGSGRSDNGGIPSASGRYSIHDLIVDDIDAVKYSGHGDLAQIAMGIGCPTLNNIVIDHVTAFPPNFLLIFGDAVTNPKMDRFTFTNSLVNSGLPPFLSTGGGATNCAYQKPPLSILQACFASSTFTRNALIAPASKFPPSTFPAGNYFPASESAVEFANYNQGNGGDYHLQSSSPYKNAGSDGKDLGAAVDAVKSAIAGVE